MPLSVTLTETQTLAITSLTVLGGDRTDVAFGKQLPEVTFSFFSCLWLARVQMTALRTALRLYLRKAACCSQRQSLCSPPLCHPKAMRAICSSDGCFDKMSLCAWDSSGPADIRRSLLAICKYELRRADRGTLEQCATFFPLLPPC